MKAELKKEIMTMTTGCVKCQTRLEITLSDPRIDDNEIILPIEFGGNVIPMPLNKEQLRALLAQIS